jgi:hypothetical protein
MGVEIDWRDFEKFCPLSSTLAILTGCECHFIVQLGMEHEEKLVEIDTLNNHGKYICTSEVTIRNMTRVWLDGLHLPPSLCSSSTVVLAKTF